MQVFFATNRNPVPADGAVTGFGPRFNPKGPAYLRVGVADLSSPAGPFPLQDPPALDRITVFEDFQGETPEGGKLYGSAQLFRMMEGLVFQGDQAVADVLVYVHGYDTSYEEALRFVAQAAANLNAQVAAVSAEADVRPVVPIVFTWPSDGLMVPELSYWSDRREAKDSGAALGRVFTKLNAYLDERVQARVRAATGRRDPATRDWRDAMRSGLLDCGVRIHLLAQSMGAYVLSHGLLDLIDERGGGDLPRLFEQIVLTGADEDADSLGPAGRLRRLPELGNRTTVYFNQSDKALLISQTSKHWSRRLGQFGPAGVIGEATLFGVDGEPVSGLAAADTPGHYYNRLNPRVQQDILRVFAGLPSDAMEGRRSMDRQRYRLF